MQANTAPLRTAAAGGHAPTAESIMKDVATFLGQTQAAVAQHVLKEAQHRLAAAEANRKLFAATKEKEALVVCNVFLIASFVSLH